LLLKIITLTFQRISASLDSNSISRLFQHEPISIFFFFLLNLHSAAEHQKETIGYSSEDASNQHTTKPHKSVQVPLPSTVFGQAIHEDESKLMKKYSELYYISPMNLKQEHNNSFILKMCSAAEWRFNKKK
jgi:hypothetical protein